MNGYNFSERVRKVLALAREEAGRLHHEYIGTEHILLGLLREGEGVAVRALIELGVESKKVIADLETTVKKGRGGAGGGPDLPYTSRAKKVLELAMAQARGLSHSYVGTEHLLLGLLAEEKGIAAQVLVDAGVSLEKVRTEILRILGSEVFPHLQVAPPLGVTGRLLSMMGLVVPSNATPPVASNEQGRNTLGTTLIAAHQIAMDRGCDYVDAVHVMLAILESGRGRAISALRLLGVDPRGMTGPVDEIAGRGAKLADTPIGFPQDGADMASFVLAAQKRWRPGTTAPDTGDLLLALLNSHPPLRELCAARGVTMETVRDALETMDG